MAVAAPPPRPPLSVRLVQLICLNPFHRLPQGDPVCDDELNSSDLSRAIDAAITSLMGEPGWLLQKKVQSGYTHALDIYSCTPDKDKWHYPRAEEATGLLKRVIDSGELRVAGVKVRKRGPLRHMPDHEHPTGLRQSGQNADWIHRPMN